MSDEKQQQRKVIRAKPRRDIPEDEKPTPAMRRAQLKNIKKAQAAVRARRKAKSK